MEYIPSALQELPSPVTGTSAKRTKLRFPQDIRKGLTEDQALIFDDMLAFIAEDTGIYYLLSGHAGSGKTTLIIALIEAWLHIYNKRYVAITATTNKAVKVLADKADFYSQYVEYRTIHSLLHLKQQFDEFGNIFFDAAKTNGYGKIDDKTGLIVIDESSMIDRKLHKIIIDRTSETDCKVIFVGDFYQIPPIGENIALIGTPAVWKQLGIRRAMLDKVVRQAAGNPIIQLATYVREHEHYQVLQFDYQTIVTPQGSLIVQDRTNKKAVFEIIRYLIANDYFKENADYSKVLAWRNDTVNKMNDIIRIMIYGRQAIDHKLLPGEKLIANKPIKDVETDNVIFANNEEFEVVRYEIDHKDIDGNTYKYFKTWVLQRLYYSSTIDPENCIKIIDILHPDSKEVFDQLLGQLYEKAQSWRGKIQAKYHWRNYFLMKERFADVKYNYCLTSHKAQGSTFRNAIVLEKDIRSNPTMPERNRLLYVAYTRPSTNLITVR